MYITVDDITSLRERVSNLAKAIREAKNNIKFFSGEGLYIYNSSEFLMAVYAKKQENPEFDITVSIGPCLYGEAGIRDNKLTRFNGLIQLAKDGLIKLYSRKTRTNKFHFYVADGGTTMLYHAEEYHPCMTPFSKRITKEGLSAEEVKKICRDFDDQLNKSLLCCKEKPEDNFLMLTDWELELLINYANDNGINYDELPQDEIKKILPKLNI